MICNTHTEPSVTRRARIVDVAPRALERKCLRPREKELVAKIMEGKSTKLIAYEMHLSYESAKQYLRRVFTVLGVHSRVELLARCLDERRGNVKSSSGRICCL
jgi:DNA-binding CsgD family transcriptional regulator